MKKFAMLSIVAAMSLSLLTACGGGGAAKTIEVVMGEGGAYTFKPDKLEVNKGDKVTVHLINKDGAAEHTFVVTDLNATSGSVAANATKDYTFTASKTGTFEFHCDVPGHKEGGMKGTLTVK